MHEKWCGPTPSSRTHSGQYCQEIKIPLSPEMDMWKWNIAFSIQHTIRGHDQKKTTFFGNFPKRANPPPQSPKNLVCGYALHTGKFLRVRKVFARIEKIAYKMKPELLSALKFSRLSGNLPLARLSRNFPDSPETFQTVWKLARLSRNFPDCPESFQTVKKVVWKLSWKSENFPESP